jgi:hypothetical protein
MANKRGRLASTTSLLASLISDAEPANKYAQLASTPNSTYNMRCFLPPHKPLTFSSQADYETHYTSSHSNRCSDCSANFPTQHFLSLHITENHDPIALAKSERGEKIYACFVEGCDKVCGEWTKRRRHLVDKHGFPRNYDFLVVNTGVDGKRSMLRAGVDEHGHRGMAVMIEIRQTT